MGSIYNETEKYNNDESRTSPPNSPNGISSLEVYRLRKEIGDIEDRILHEYCVLSQACENTLCYFARRLETLKSGDDQVVAIIIVDLKEGLRKLLERVEELDPIGRPQGYRDSFFMRNLDETITLEDILEKSNEELQEELQEEVQEESSCGLSCELRNLYAENTKLKEVIKLLIK